MANLQDYKCLPFDKSYHKVIKELHAWYRKIRSQLEQMCDEILLDLNTTLDDVHYFASLANVLLIEQEKQLEKATSNEQMDRIQDRINQIIFEVKHLQSLSFQLNCDSVKLNSELQIYYNNDKIKPNCSLAATSPHLYKTPRTISDSSDLSTNTEQLPLSNRNNNNYRFLISRDDAIELEKTSLPVFHLTSSTNELINECVLTFHVNDLDSFVNAFDSYWNIFRVKNEIRMLTLQHNIAFIMGKLGETSRLLAKRFQLDQIKVFSNLCPKSDERILLINGKNRDLIRECIEEIYYNIEENNKDKYLNENIKLYNPANLSSEDIDETNIDYGGFTQIRTRSRMIQNSQSNLTEDEKYLSSDDDLWDENDEWWNSHQTRDNNSETIQREMIISNMHAGVIIGVNASRIDQIKRKTGAYVYINGETSDIKRTVFMKGTHEQVDRAYACIENLIERHKNDKLPIKQRRSLGKRKGK